MQGPAFKAGPVAGPRADVPPLDHPSKSSVAAPALRGTVKLSEQATGGKRGGAHEGLRALGL